MGIFGADGRPIEKPRTSKGRRGSDYATLNEVVNIAHNTSGPLAIAMQEMMAKIARVEDQLGITDESVARPSTRKERAGRVWRYVRSIPRTVRDLLTDAPVKGTSWAFMKTAPSPVIDQQTTPGPQFNRAELGDPAAVGGDVE